MKSKTKLAERPIADVILGPLARLPLAPDMAAEIAMRWDVLGPVGHQRFAAGDPRADDVDAADEPDERGEHARWLADTRRLVDRVREHSRGADFRARLLSDMGKADDANNFADLYAADLAALVRRDPRYLAADLVVGSLLLWKLMVIRGLQHRRHDSNRGKISARARTYLRELADAASGLAVVTGRGRLEFIDPIMLLADHEHHVDVVRDVVASIKSGKDDDEIANATKLSPVSIAAIRKRQRAVKEHAEQLTLDLYGRPFKENRLRKHLREAADALADVPGVFESRASRRVQRRPK